MRTVLCLGVLLMMLVTASLALAHTPLCSCWDNGDGTITCEGGFSDGSSAAGVLMHVLDADGKEIKSGQMSKVSEYTFDKPEGDFTVKFDAGEGHKIEIPGSEIH